MCFKWPCSLHSLLSPNWLPNDVVTEIWANDAETLSVYKEGHLLYSEFSRLSAQLAEYLRPLSPILVGVLWSPNVYTVVVVHGILLSNSAFLPFSNTERFSELLELLGAVVCLSSNTDFLEEKFISVQTIPFKVYVRKGENPHRLPTSDLAYCITTSGTAGAPKLVLAGHSCVSANVTDLYNRLPPVGEFSGVFITAPLTFDACIVQIYLGLATHRRLIFPSASILFSMDGEHLANLISSANIDIWQCTPSVFSRLPYLSSSVNDRMWVFLGGEPCSPTRLLSKGYRNWKLFFLYGLTEVSAWSSIVNVSALEIKEPPRIGATPLGVPMEYSEVVLKDVDKETGIGQVYIGRMGGGYATVEEPFTRVSLLIGLQRMSQADLIATGDFAVATEIESSPLWFLGRKDRLVKVHGKKCYLECLENEILNLLSGYFKPVSHHVVNCRCEAYPLRARIQLNESLSVKDANDLKQHLLRRLSFPILPQNVDFSNSLMVLNLNGKVVDKSIRLACLSSVGPISKGEYQLTFQQLGGSSLRAMHLIEVLISDWPILKAKKALLLSTLFSKPFAEFIRVAEESSLARTETIEDISAPSAVKQQKQEFLCEAELVWSSVLGKCVDASAVVNIATNSLFIGSHAGVFKKLNFRTGEVIWSRTVGSRIEATACLLSDLVVFGTLDGKIYALKVGNGEVAWVVETGGAVKSAPTEVPQLRRLLIGSHGRQVLSIEYGGNTVWTSSLDESPIVAPITLDANSEFAFAGTLGGSLHRFSVELGITNWSVYELGPIFGAPVLLINLGYVVVATADGSVHSISECGGERLWSISANPSGGFFSSPVLVLSPQLPVLLLANQSGHLHAIRPVDGNIMWTIDTSVVERSESSRTAFLTAPSVVPLSSQHFRSSLAIVFARTDGCVFVCDDSVEPTPHLIYRLPSETFSAPLVLHLEPSVLSIMIGCRNDTVNRLDVNLINVFKSNL